jgi:hypothetical protein
MNFLYSMYFALPNFERIGLPGKAINRMMLFVLKRVFDLLVPFYFNRTMHKQGKGINTEKRKETYIVSLTSFPARINEIWITIETILRQNIKPDRIILWLAEEQFPDKKLPESLNRLKDRGLTIDFCKDLRSHKKYYFSLINYPESNIITLDDDLYYHKDVLKNVIELHEKFPDLIATNRAHKITVRGKSVNPYSKWKHNVVDAIPSHLLVATGGAGTLYPPGALPEEVFDEKLFKELCFHADDIWLKVMELKNNKMIVTNRRFNKSFVSVGSTQNQKLVSENIMLGGNDVQLSNLLTHFRIDLMEKTK